MIEAIRDILAQHGRLAQDVAQLDPDDDLYRAGMTSHASIEVMLALEDRFDAEFPDALLTRSSFATMRQIEAALRNVLAD